MQALLKRFFYKSGYDFYDVIQRVSKGLATKVDLREIQDFVGDTIYTTLGLSVMHILSYSIGGYYRVVYVKRSDAMLERGKGGFSIREDSALVRFLNKTRDMLVLNRGDTNQDEIEEIKKTLEPFMAEVVVPIFVDNNLSHIMVLGRKVSGDTLSLEDSYLLNTISNQTSIAIKQAQLYSGRFISDRFASLGMMFATFAHEIRNPLTSLKTFTELLPERYNDPDFRETFKQVVLDDIEKINALLRDMFESSTLGWKGGECIFSLRGLIDEGIEYINKRFRNIIIERDYKELDINIKGNRERLRQAFLNIIGNGCQAMSEGGVLRIGIISDSRDINISISDAGKGIAPHELGRVFEPFYTTKEDGMGLGLLIAKEVVREHGGDITVESNPGYGTTFIIRLPRHLA
ncbi:MAG: hypothetical protein Fur0020_06950 [Thermodesulfovibrionia bacterium]